MSDLNPLESITDTLAFYCRDLSTDHRDAWIYGIAVGWDDESLKELRVKHNWDEKTVTRLKLLHSKYESLNTRTDTVIVDECIEAISANLIATGNHEYHDSIIDKDIEALQQVRRKYE